MVRDVSDGVAQRIRWGYATYPTGFGTGSEGVGGGTEHLQGWSGIPIRVVRYTFEVVATTCIGGRLDLRGGTEHLQGDTIPQSM
ncbi:hypothetical protein [Alistipes sp. ZOR0009]|uniref:hypothetical protein n=1 Tax=Alistipes sp. ZOR0009 TaxID=1339253 RepID=UPI0012E0660A|nr:hypothetical protein [Alistipes sp. ZOR0009]